VRGDIISMFEDHLVSSVKVRLFEIGVMLDVDFFIACVGNLNFN